MTFIKRFGNFQISLRSRGLISVTRFSVKSAVSVKVSVSRTTAEIRLLKFLCDGTISTSNGQRRLWPCLSCADRFSANLPIPCARRVAITNNKSFAVLSLERVRLSSHAFILLPLCDVVGGVDRLHYSLYYYTPSFTAWLAFMFSTRMIFGYNENLSFVKLPRQLDPIRDNEQPILLKM